MEFGVAGAVGFVSVILLCLGITILLLCLLRKVLVAWRRRRAGVVTQAGSELLFFKLYTLTDTFAYSCSPQLVYESPFVQYDERSVFIPM